MTEEELKELLGDRWNPKPQPPAEPEAPVFSEADTEPLPEPEIFPEPEADIPPEPFPQQESPAADEPPFPDPFAAPETAPPPAEDDPFTYSDADTDAPPKNRHIGLRVFTLFVTLVFIGFAMFCIIWDVRHGTTSGGSYRAGNIVKVEIVQQNRKEKPSPLQDENGRYTYEGIAKTVMPSIVEIYTYADGKLVGSGSGIILTADGFIATNAHVVSDAKSYSVKLFDESQEDQSYEAALVGHDTKTDLAVLKIPATGLTPAVLGNSDDVQLGESVCALGNPAGLSGSITTGIISGINRKVRADSSHYEMDCFQTDAAISPGNSGGALVDMYGKVIGITSSKYGSSIFTGSVYEGLGFAITVNAALPIIKELTENGYIAGRVRIGIRFYENSSAKQQAAADEKKLPDMLDGTGILVVDIDKDSDLSKTILKPGDWILSMNGHNISNYDSINKALDGAVAGDSVHARCARIQSDGSVKTFEIDFRLLEDKSGDY